MTEARYLDSVGVSTKCSSFPCNLWPICETTGTLDRTASSRELCCALFHSSSHFFDSKISDFISWSDVFPPSPLPY